MKRLPVALLAALILIASVSADAQTTAPAPAAAPAASPEATAAALNMMDAMKMRETLTVTMKQMTKSLPQMMTQMAAATINGDPRLDAAKKKEAIAQAEKKIPEMAASMQTFFEDPKMIDEMVSEIVPIYARNFTAEELNQIATFYKTPAGSKVMRVMPQLMNESMMVSQKVITPRLTKMMEKLVPLAAK